MFYWKLWRLRYQLRSKDWRVANAAAEALVNIGDARAFDSLVAVLRDKDENVRQVAAEALGKIGDARAVEPLVAALRDKDGEVREKAEEALRKIGSTHAVILIAMALRDQNWEVSRGIWVLQKLLEQTSEGMPENSLRAVATLNDTVSGIKFSWSPPVCERSGYWSGEQDEVECSHIRQLARQELIRRGLEA